MIQEVSIERASRRIYDIWFYQNERIIKILKNNSNFWKFIFWRIFKVKSTFIIISVDIKTIQWSDFSLIITITIKIAENLFIRVTKFLLLSAAELGRARLRQSLGKITIFWPLKTSNFLQTSEVVKIIFFMTSKFKLKNKQNFQIEPRLLFCFFFNFTDTGRFRL